MKKYNVAILGATGAVGQEFLNLIEERNFPFAELKMLASKRSAGKKIQFMGKEYTVEEATEDSFKGVDIALFAGGAASKTFAPAAVKAGAIVIGILLGTMVAFIIDRRLDKVAIVAFVGAVLSFIGIIHSAAITINFTNQWGIGYLITGVVCLILHFGRNSWCKPDEDMLEYVDDQSEKE